MEILAGIDNYDQNGLLLGFIQDLNERIKFLTGQENDDSEESLEIHAPNNDNDVEVAGEDYNSDE